MGCRSDASEFHDPHPPEGTGTFPGRAGLLPVMGFGHEAVAPSPVRASAATPRAHR